MAELICFGCGGPDATYEVSDGRDGTFRVCRECRFRRDGDRPDLLAHLAERHRALVRVKFRPTLTLVIPTIGRPTLARTLDSLRGQPWGPGDAVLLVCDDPAAAPVVRELYPQFGLPVRYHETAKLGHYGHGVRNWVQGSRLVKTTHRAQLDDDDVWMPDALRTVRAAITEEPARPHIFKMDWRNAGEHRPAADRPVLWAEPVMREANVGTPMLVAPFDPSKDAEWEPRYNGDFAHIAGTCARYPGGPVWHNDVICYTRPHLDGIRHPGAIGYVRGRDGPG